MISSSWIQWCFRHARSVLLILGLLIVSGAATYVMVPKESTPDIKIPIIYVTAAYEGISPDDSERLILRPIEQRCRSIDGLKTISSTGFEGGGSIVMEFIAGHNVDKARRDVREKVDEAKQDLPKDMRDPTVNEVNLSLMPVLIIMLSGDLPDRALYLMAERLKDAIESQAPSVLEAKIVGNREEQVEIIISPQKLEAYGIAFDDVFRLLSRNNMMVSAGRLIGDKGDFTIRVPGLIETVQDVLDLPILSEQTAVVKLKDIADIRRNYKDATSIARNMGTKAISIEVSKRTGENVINTIQAVRKVVEKEQKYWPSTVKVTLAQDDSKRILDMIKDLKNHLISAVILVMVVVVMSLGLRSALLVGVAIPGSFLTGILMIGLMGFTINIVVLFGLILSIGMLVDGAIIVVEYADRKMAEGLGRQEAYALASKRMLWPVITSISTILVVFLPLIFWPGVTGEFMKYLPYTLLATLTASLLMALVFVPTLGSLFGKLPEGHLESIEMVRISESGDLHQLKGLSAHYCRFLNRALNHPQLVTSSAIGILIVVIFAYGKLGKGIEFFPDVEPKSAAVLIHARGNTSLEEKDAIVRHVENRLLDMTEFRSIYATTKLSFGQESALFSEDVIGKIAFEFIDWDKRRTVKKILQEVEGRIQDIPGIRCEIQKEGSGPAQGKPIQLELTAHNLASLAPAFQRLKGFVSSLPNVANVEDNLPIPGITWEITVNRGEAAKYGLDVAAIGNAIKLATNGIIVTTYRPNDSREEIDIIMRFDKENRTLNALDHLRVHTPAGMVPIKTFMVRKPQKRLSMVHRCDGQRVMTLKADVKTGALVNDAISAIKTWSQSNLDGGELTLSFKGEEEDKGETSRFLLMAFGIAIFMMAAILVTQFNSFFSTILVLSSIVISSVGVLIGLMVMQVPFSIVMCGIGIIALAGIIVSNNIILIDTFDQLADHIVDKREAILRTGVQRLRPVILTKLTAILGLLPIMFRLDIDYVSFQVHLGSPATLWWQQIAISIVFGVAFASLLTLFVTPCALMIRENVRLKRKEAALRRA